jgi:hypothetical protein
MEENLDFVSYKARWGRYIIRFTEGSFRENQTFIQELAQLASNMQASPQED